MPPRRDRLAERLAGRLAEQGALRLWKRAADAAGELDLDTLRELRSRARRTRREIDRLLEAADSRLTRPLLASNAMNRPLGADWLWRPGPWRQRLATFGQAGLGPRTELAEGAVLFHDCPLCEAGYRQLRNTRPGDLAPFGLRIEVLGFAGSFLSLALDLPPGGSEGLRRQHVYRAELDIEAERPVPMMARLNVLHGPNTAQIPARIPETGGGPTSVEFDLAHSGVNERRVGKIWLDIMFERPAMSAVTLRDLTLSRRPRAEL